ncbi:hypothetical protein QYF61_023096 [Mycteria americana]|uniref:Uncharacterized protein n=1 Tax=Mycteria americana TaxID=33587 RepID=A0AAN7PKH6_MYCAM|nr:hypothetical protein QYF61_023096 [Mycteria americana]
MLLPREAVKVPDRFAAAPSHPALLNQLVVVAQLHCVKQPGAQTNKHLGDMAKQSQLPQQLLIKLLLTQTLHQLCCPSLDRLQHLNISLVVGGPKLNTVFKAPGVDELELIKKKRKNVKKIKKEDPENYRPVSLTLILGKVIE